MNSSSGSARAALAARRGLAPRTCRLGLVGLSLALDALPAARPSPPAGRACPCGRCLLPFRADGRFHDAPPRAHAGRRGLSPNAGALQLGLDPWSEISATAQQTGDRLRIASAKHPIRTEKIAARAKSVGWHVHCKFVAACRSGPAGTTMERVTMSTFDNPFDPKRRLNRSGCSCGRHVDQVEHDREAARDAAMRAGRERGQALRGRRRLRRDARDVSEGRGAPRVPQIGRRLDRARRALAVLPAQDRDRSVRAGRRRSRRRTSRSASSRSPAPRRSSWRTRWASMPSTASTSR